MNASHPRTVALVYAVDDLPPILDLYVLLLESIGCTVAAFDDRTLALAALAAEQRKPDLLITDHCGGSVPVKQFMFQSTALHPRLRILMASGLFDPGLRTGGIRPDLFIQKPFTNEEFTRAVEMALAMGNIEAIPTNFIIDQQGMIAGKHVGYVEKQQFETEIKRMLKL